MGAVVAVDRVEVLGAGPFAAVNVGVADGAAEHVGAFRPRAGAAEDHGEVDAIRFHLAGGERHDAGVVGTGQGDLEVGHGVLRACIEECGIAGGDCVGRQ